MADAIHQWIVEDAAKAGVDPLLALATAKQESNFNPYLGNSRSSAFGLFQFIDDNWRDYGINPRDPVTRDPAVQIKYGVDRIKQNHDGLSVSLGRSPDHHEVYLAHVFGLRGAQLILGSSDDTDLRQVRPEKVFTANPWIDQNGLKTVGHLKEWFRSKTAKRLAEVQPLVDPYALGTPWPGTTATVVDSTDLLTKTRVKGAPSAPQQGSVDYANVPGTDPRLTDADMARWPLQHFKPEEFRSKDGAPLDLSLKAALALDQVRGEFGAPINISATQRSPGRDALDVDLSGMSDEAKQRFLALAMKSGFTSFGFFTNEPDRLRIDTREQGTASFFGASGRNFLQWSTDGSARNFPKEHWASPVMGLYRRGMKSQEAAAAALRDPRQASAFTPEEARTQTGSPALSLPAVTPGDISSRDTVPASPFTQAEQREQQRALEASQPGLVETAQLAASNQWSMLWAIQNGQNRFERDPNWQLTDDWIKKNVGDLPLRFYDGLEHSLSEAHATFLAEQAHKAHEIEQKLGSLGWRGVAANLTAAILDPTAIALAVASDGLLAPWLLSAKATRLSRAVIGGLSVGTQNAALETLLYKEKPGAELRDILYASAGGLMLGSVLFGASRPLLRAENEAMAAAAQKVRENIDAELPLISGPNKSIGAAVVPNVRRPLNQNASEALAEARMDPAAKTWKPPFTRFDAVGQTLNSKHPLAAKTMDGLGEDAVGRVGHEVNTLSATEYQTWYHRRHMNQFYRVATPAWNEYAESLGLGRFEFRKRAQAYEEFMESVTRRIRDPYADVSPQAQKVAKELQDRYEEMLRDLKEPGIKDGAVLPPVKGFEEVLFNRQYTPRIWHPGKISKARALYGDEKMEKYLAAAYRARNPITASNDPAAAFALSEKFGKVFWKRLREHHADGGDSDLTRALSGDDVEALRAQLYSALDEVADMSKEDIDAIVDGLRVADTGGYARAKQRALLDENFAAQIEDGNGVVRTVRVDDLLENSAERLFGMYSRNISGALAMARLGYPSIQDFNRRLNHVKASAEEVKDYDPNDLARDIRNLEYVATYVTGSPIGDFGRELFRARGSGWGEFARVMRDINFLRLMGQLGFAQAAETFSILGHMGIKSALAGMPTLRSLIRDARTGKLQDELANELELWVGLGTDRLRKSAEFRHEDFGHYLDPYYGENIAFVRGLLDRGKIGLGELSGANAVNTVLHRWAMRSIAQKFADFMQPRVGAEAAPPAPGMVRVYHGGSPVAGEKAPLWVTTDRRYAEGWAARDPNMRVWYADLPRSDARFTPADELPGAPGMQTVERGFTFNFELTPTERANIRPLVGDSGIDAGSWRRRLNAYGLDPDSQVAKNIAREMAAHATYVDSALGNRKLTQFNLDNWDPATAEEFALVMHRTARHVIQENDPGNMHAFMSKPGVQLLTQFRNFMIVAHSKQLLHGLHMRDAYTTMTFVGTMVSAGLAYVLQTYSASLVQRDREKFLKERLSPERIGAAAFSRAGWSAMIPLAADNVAAYTGFKTPFGTRYSGLQPTGLLQNPTFDFVNSAAHIPFDAVRAAMWRDYDWSEQDFKRFYNILPFKNVIGVSHGLNAIGRSLPDESRRQ